MNDNPVCPDCGGRSVKAGKRPTGRQLHACTQCTRRFSGFGRGRPCIGDRPLTAEEKYQKRITKKKLLKGLDN